MVCTHNGPTHGSQRKHEHQFDMYLLHYFWSEGCVSFWNNSTMVFVNPRRIVWITVLLVSLLVNSFGIPFTDTLH